MSRRNEFLERVLDSFFVYFNKDGKHFIEPLNYDPSREKLVRIQKEKSKIQKTIQEDLNNPSFAKISPTQISLLNNVHEPNWSDPVLYTSPSADESHLNYMSLYRAVIQLRTQVQTPVIRLKDLAPLVKTNQEHQNIVLPISQIEYRREILTNSHRKYCDFLCSRLSLEKEKIENRQSFGNLSIQDGILEEEPRKKTEIPSELEQRIKNLTLM